VDGGTGSPEFQPPTAPVSTDAGQGVGEGEWDAGNSVWRWHGRGRGGAVEKKNLTSGVHASARGERDGVEDGRREIKKKTHFYNYANGARGLSGLGRPVGFGLRERRGQREPAGPKAEWA
jgi:hypothetical protein